MDNNNCAYGNLVSTTTSTTNPYYYPYVEYTLPNADYYYHRYEEYFPDSGRGWDIHTYPDYDRSEIEKLKEEIANLKKEKCPMKTLYNVVVVSEDEKVLLEKKTVAEDESEASFNVGVSDVIKEAGLKPRQVTVIYEKVGEVRVKKEVQKVKVIKDED